MLTLGLVRKHKACWSNWRLLTLVTREVLLKNLFLNVDVIAKLDMQEEVKKDLKTWTRKGDRQVTMWWTLSFIFNINFYFPPILCQLHSTSAWCSCMKLSYMDHSFLSVMSERLANFIDCPDICHIAWSHNCKPACSSEVTWFCI